MKTRLIDSITITIITCCNTALMTKSEIIEMFQYFGKEPFEVGEHDIRQFTRVWFPGKLLQNERETMNDYLWQYVLHKRKYYFASLK